MIEERVGEGQLKNIKYTKNWSIKLKKIKIRKINWLENCNCKKSESI